MNTATQNTTALSEESLDTVQGGLVSTLLALLVCGTFTGLGLGIGKACGVE